MGWQDKAEKRRREKAWKIGYRAGKAGRTASDNPYPSGTPEYEGWRAGQYVAEAESR